MTEDRRKLPMTPGEIVSNYRQAADPKNQIKILADLNVCTPREIEEVLRAEGIDLPATRMAKWTVQEEDQLRRLAAEGKSASEIAKLVGRTHKAVEQKLSKLHISLRNQQPVMKKALLESLPAGKDIVEQALTKGLEDIGDEVKEQAQEIAMLDDVAPITTELKFVRGQDVKQIEVNLEDVVKDFERHHSELEIRRLRDDAVSSTLLTVLFDTLYSTDLNANLETVFARFGIKLLDYLKER